MDRRASEAYGSRADEWHLAQVPFAQGRRTRAGTPRVWVTAAARWTTLAIPHLFPVRGYRPRTRHPPRAGPATAVRSDDTGFRRDRRGFLTRPVGVQRCAPERERPTIPTSGNNDLCWNVQILCHSDQIRSLTRQNDDCAARCPALPEHTRIVLHDRQPPNPCALSPPRYHTMRRPYGFALLTTGEAAHRSRCPRHEDRAPRYVLPSGTQDAIRLRAVAGSRTASSVVDHAEISQSATPLEPQSLRAVATLKGVRNVGE
jgi:hypothetical protein